MSTHDPSGLSIAEEAHAAGAVEPATEQVPAHTVELRFTFHGSEQHARELVDSVAWELMSRSDVTACEHTVTSGG